MNHPLSYDQVLDDLLRRLPMFSRTGGAAYKPGLENVNALLKEIGHPEKDLKCIHIAGTNGKGSVSHLLASIFQEAGYKTGLYTSPHLKDFRERIQVNGEMIPKEKVVDWYLKLIDKATALKASFFELTVAMMLGHFKEEKVDLAIIETGMGGRLDSTNVVQPVLSIITNIGLDHQQFLGNTLQEIAGEKAGIIKQDTPVLIGRRQLETEEVFRRKADMEHSSMLYADDIIREVQWREMSKCEVIRNDGRKLAFRSALTAEYQRENIATVVAAVDWLNALYLKKRPIEDEYIRKGLENVLSNTGFKGRWQVIKAIPKVVLDVAHNEDGIQEVLKQLERENYDKLRIVYGAVRDKDVGRILSLLPKDAEYYFCEPPLPRKLPVDSYHELAPKAGIQQFTIIPDPKLAYKTALYHTAENDLLLVAGSFFIVAELV